MTLLNPRVGLAAAAAAGLILAGCAPDSTAGEGQPSVLASFYPLAYVAERIAAPDAAVVNLTQPGVEAHDMELTGQQVGQVADAGLVVYLSGFQPAVDQAVEQNAADRALDVADVVGLAGAGGDEGPEHDHDATADLDADPHVWLDPTVLADVADAVADRLGEIAPAEASGFRQRADELIDELHELDREYQTGLADCTRRTFVTSHGAFGHVAERYGLEMVGVSGIDPEAQPSPARLAEVQRVIESEGVTTIFHERLVSPEVAQALAADLGVRTAVLDPIEGLTEETSDEDYFSLMRANLDALREANGCS